MNRLLPLALLGLAMAPTARDSANEVLFQELLDGGTPSAQVDTIREIFARSPYIGQGNPAITRHPMTEAECRSDFVEDPADVAICGAPRMAPLYDPATQDRTEATVCIDRFEFPNLPCVYPVTWVRAAEAPAICEAQGKRLCDAHEWEGACAGALGPPDYRFDLAKGRSELAAQAAMREAHNARYQATRAWSYGPAPRTGVCAQASTKSPDCNGGQWSTCGSNTYPAGAFPDCSTTTPATPRHATRSFGETCRTSCGCSFRSRCTPRPTRSRSS
jgi:hypothetical protein